MYQPSKTFNKHVKTLGKSFYAKAIFMTLFSILLHYYNTNISVSQLNQRVLIQPTITLTLYFIYKKGTNFMYLIYTVLRT